jgi:hypothetical protein
VADAAAWTMVITRDIASSAGAVWGEVDPKHANAVVAFKNMGGKTRIVLSMTFLTQDEYDHAISLDAPSLGRQTSGRLARFVGAK